MDLALAIARSGLEAHHKNIEVISNNLANANTTAFKKNRAEFQDLPYNILKQPGSPTSDETNNVSGFVIGSGTKLANNKKIFKEGTPIATEQELDMAIVGRGFFKIQLPDSSDYAYTRAGNFTRNDQNQITLQNGYIVQPPITIPQNANNLQISDTGIVTVTPQGSTTPQQIGQLELTDFITPEGLTPVGENLYLANNPNDLGTSANPGQNGYGVIKQFTLEGSNVSVVEEMVNLIEAQRAFEVTSKAVSAVDNMMETLSRAT